MVYDFFNSINMAHHIYSIHIVRRNGFDPHKRDKLAYCALPSYAVAQEVLKMHNIHISRQDGRFFRVKVEEVSQYQTDNSHYFSFDHRVGKSQQAFNLQTKT